ncbi:hypothetical protein OKW45_006791 [Paraburkholderia sp. WSM4175]|uniref:hypothetical protein n=1 Tax=Paraburkholderia sp. WSM4175 TaxID=2991072 RepID=UPI003D19A62D
MVLDKKRLTQTQNTARPQNSSHRDQANGQLRLFSDDERVGFSFQHDATLVCQGLSAIFVASGTQYRLKPIPKMPETALARVMMTMVQLHHERDSWRPNLQKAGDVIEHTLKSGPQCVIALWGKVQNRFVGVLNEEGLLQFHFPHPDQWADIGLDWLLAERCGCGRFDCDPAPFRRLPCPEADW